MALKSGDRIGPYEITRLLGSGGMGEVYRASEVWYVQGQDLLGVALRETAGGVTSTPARRVWSAPEGTELFSQLGQRGFGTVDGTRFLVRQPAPPGDWRITIVQNLPELLRGARHAR